MRDRAAVIADAPITAIGRAVHTDQRGGARNSIIREHVAIPGKGGEYGDDAVSRAAALIGVDGAAIAVIGAWAMSVRVP